ncbi:MFS transporter [Escherichia coli]
MLGIAVGIASYTAPLYLSEMASENVRGKMIDMYQLMVTLGIVLAFLSDTAFSYSGNWRAMLGACFTSSPADYSGGFSCQIARAGWRKGASY